jgi:hypothetical protein
LREIRPDLADRVGVAMAAAKALVAEGNLLGLPQIVGHAEW